MDGDDDGAIGRTAAGGDDAVGDGVFSAAGAALEPDGGRCRGF